jgi:hypothetical protein
VPLGSLDNDSKPRFAAYSAPSIAGRRDRRPFHYSVYSAVDCTPGTYTHIVVRRVEIHHTGQVGAAFRGSDGLEFAHGYPVLIEDCYVHDNGGDGIDLNSRDRQGNATGVLVLRSRLNGIKLWATVQEYCPSWKPGWTIFPNPVNASIWTVT